MIENVGGSSLEGLFRPYNSKNVNGVMRMQSLTPLPFSIFFESIEAEN